MDTTRAFATILSAMLCLDAAHAAQVDRIRGPIESSRAVPLRESIHPKTRLANDSGAVDQGTRINSVKLVLSQSDIQRQDLEQLLEAQRDPSSPDYRNWLTPEQYGERFGLSENDLARITSWLQSRGFVIEDVARARNWITFNGTAGQIARAFGTELHSFQVGGEGHFANATEVWIPAALAGVVSSIRGLDDFRPKPQRATTLLLSRIQQLGRSPLPQPGRSRVDIQHPDSLRCRVRWNRAKACDCGANGCESRGHAGVPGPIQPDP